MIVVFLIFLTCFVFISCDNVNSLKKKGDEQFAAGNFEQAINFYSKAINKKPSPQLHISRSEVYLKQENTASALEDLNTAINLDPSLIDGYFARAAVYFDTKDYNLAISDYNKVIELRPDFIDGYIARASVYFAMEDFNSARSDYNHVLSIDPENEIAIEGITKTITNMVKNTTWSAYPVINGTNMRNYNNGYLMMTLRFGAANTYRMITEIGGYYTGPTAYGFKNGQKIPGNTTTNQGSFEIKGTNIQLKGDIEFLLQFKDDIILLNEVEEGSSFVAQFRR